MNKTALITGAAKGIGRGVAEHGIFVYEIRPGIVKTDMTSTVRDKYDRFIEEGGLPIKRWGYPADIARAISGLAEG